MKKILTIIAFCLVVTNFTSSAVKLNLSIGNFRIVSGYLTADVKAQVLTGQNWRVGSSNIRIDWVTTPASRVSIKTDNPAYNPNSNIHQNSVPCIKLT